MRDILRKAKPQRLDDLIALNALYRPGPLRSGMVDDYIARKQGKTEISYELPQLEPILADTYGVIAYQEQVMRIANVRRRLHARRSRPAAQGDGQEERRGDGEACAASSSRARRSSASARRRPAHALRPDGALRRLRLQQVALDGLRVPRLSDGVSEGELPVALRGGAADDRGAEHRQARAVSRRVPRSRRSRCCRPTSTRASCGSPSSRQGRPLRPDRDQERRRGRDRVAARRSARSRDASDRSTRCARISICGSSTSACSRA